MESKSSFWKRFASSKSGSTEGSGVARQVRVSVGGGGGSKGKNQSQNIPQSVYLKRSLLQDYLTQQSDEPSLDSVSQLGRLCLDESIDPGMQNTNIELIYCGALLLEWSHYRGDDLTPIYYRRLAGAHYEAWMKRGVIGEVCK